MINISKMGAAVIAFSIAFGASSQASSDANINKLLSTIKLPPGFKISLFAKVPRARSMAIGTPLGTVFVGSRHGTIHMLRDRDKDGVAEEIVLKTDKLKVPNGVAYNGMSLYIVEQNQITFWAGPSEFDTARPLVPLIPIVKNLPNKFLHGWRYAAFGPDKKLYVAVGSPCNVCQVSGHEGKIIRMDGNGKNIETVASGVRNSVGFDWHPKTKELFFTDNGSDGMGDDIPADELNHVTKMGQFFGFPFYGGGKTRTPQTKDKQAPKNSVSPVIEFQAHSANLGIHFYSGNMFPSEYKNDAFVAQHGSWNRSSPVGYQLMRVRFNDKGKAVGKEVFASGWLKGNSAWGRPVDIKMIADGSLLVSDDFVGAIYRISYQR